MSATAFPADFAEEPALTEADRVRLWRENEFLRMGYTQAEAFYLASFSDADLHVVEALIKQGCSLNLAARIAS